MQREVSRNSDPAARTGPIVIGVAGRSGSGKTTVVRRIVDSLGDDQVTVLEHDRYYLEFVEPSKCYADIIVPQGGHNAIDMLLTLIRGLAGPGAAR